MKVRELIEKLNDINPDLEVMHSTSSYPGYEVDDVFVYNDFIELE